MSKKLAKKLARNFFFVSILLNVLFPWLLAKINIGDRTGEINMIYIPIAIWSVVSLLLYTIYFTIPDYTKNWERVATFLFPTFLFSVVLFIDFLFFIIPWGMNLLFNIICMLYYKQAMKKTIV